MPTDKPTGDYKGYLPFRQLHAKKVNPLQTPQRQRLMSNTGKTFYRHGKSIPDHAGLKRKNPISQLLYRQAVMIFLATQAFLARLLL
jgi:hypothetical protein